MPKTIRFHETGGAAVLKVEDLPLTDPGEGEVRLKVEALTARRSCFVRDSTWKRPSSLRESAVKQPGSSTLWGPAQPASKSATV